jgi:hypothetical protein
MKFEGQPPLTVAERVARCKARKVIGLVKPRVEFHFGDVADLLVDKKFLQQWDAENIDKVVAALEVALRVWVSRVTR